MGATGYLTKPVDADQILAAFEPAEPQPARPARRRQPLARVEWEHIQRVLADCDGNISQAARLLGLHRRSLQRKLLKHPVPRAADVTREVVGHSCACHLTIARAFR